MMNVLISGASSGIGAAIAHAFASEGANIAFCSRTEADLIALKARLSELNPNGRFFYKAVDVSVKPKVQLFAKEAESFFEGKIDVLVNNAGVFLPGTIQEEEDDVFEKQINTNLASAYHLTRAVLPALRKSPKAHIFNICSTASIVAYTNGGSYCISKFALLGFSKVLREELKEKRVSVTSVLPGATLTRSWAGADFPEDRFMKASDVADAVLSAWKLAPSAVIEEILMRPMEGDF
jgi:short-subunit dehydrogenase